MNKHKGIVFETTSAYSIFLTSDGLFEKGIPLTSSVQIGEEVYFRPFQNKKQQKLKDSYNSRWTAPIISVVATIVLLFSVLLPAQSNVSAYVQIDINPSIELGINNAGKVFLFKGLNDEGVEIKRDISFWKGKPLSWVLLQIVDRTESHIEQTEVIEITTIYQNEMDHEKLEKVIETAVTTSATQALPKKQSIKVTEATVSDWKSATNKGISVQEYQKERKEMNKVKHEKVKKNVKSETKKTETKKNQDKPKIEKGLKEKNGPKNEKIKSHNNSMKQEKQKMEQNNSKKDQSKEKQNNSKRDQTKEKQKVNYKKEKPNEKYNVKHPTNQKTKSTKNKNSNSHHVKKDRYDSGIEKKDLVKKERKEIKRDKETHEKVGNTKATGQKDAKTKQDRK
jgi:hypothetical protein